MKGRIGVKSAKAAFVLVCTLVPALFGRVDAALGCFDSSWSVHDSQHCWVDEINARFSGAKLGKCINGDHFSTSTTDAQKTVDAINNYALYTGPKIGFMVSTRARIFCSIIVFRVWMITVLLRAT